MLLQTIKYLEQAKNSTDLLGRVNAKLAELNAQGANYKIYQVHDTILLEVEDVS